MPRASDRPVANLAKGEELYLTGTMGIAIAARTADCSEVQLTKRLREKGLIRDRKEGIRAAQARRADSTLKNAETIEAMYASGLGIRTIEMTLADKDITYYRIRNYLLAKGLVRPSGTHIVQKKET